MQSLKNTYIFPTFRAKLPCNIKCCTFPAHCLSSWKQSIMTVWKYCAFVMGKSEIMWNKEVKQTLQHHIADSSSPMIWELLVYLDLEVFFCTSLDGMNASLQQKKTEMKFYSVVFYYFLFLSLQQSLLTDFSIHTVYIPVILQALFCMYKCRDVCGCAVPV